MPELVESEPRGLQYIHKINLDNIDKTIHEKDYIVNKAKITFLNALSDLNKNTKLRIKSLKVC